MMNRELFTVTIRLFVPDKRFVMSNKRFFAPDKGFVVSGRKLLVISRELSARRRRVVSGIREIFIP